MVKVQYHALVMGVGAMLQRARNSWFIAIFIVIIIIIIFIFSAR